MIRFVGCFFLILSAITCQAKVIAEHYKLTTELTIRIEGEITHKTLDEFKKALKDLDSTKQPLKLNSVVLDSIGGSGSVAKEIGKIIRSRGLNTYLPSDASCASACVDILISGVQRYAFGDVLVHRSTFFGESHDDSKVESIVAYARKLEEDYIRSMGVSMMLADAIDTTESWRLRKLTDSEKKRWQVFGTDRVAEEILFNQIARKRYISRHEFIGIFKTNYEDCLVEAKEFKRTVFDCAEIKNRKPPNILVRSTRAIEKWIDKQFETEQPKKQFPENVSDLKEKIYGGQIYLRYMLVSELNGSKTSIAEASFKSLSKTEVDQIEAANTWWVEENKIHVLLKNPTKHSIKEFTFSLSDADCKSSGKKRLLQFQLPTMLEDENSVVYSSELPFNYLKAIGKGSKCGVIEAVLVG
jgi:hypothetical protein